MNRSQRYVLIGAVLALAIAAFPPWYLAYERSRCYCWLALVSLAADLW
jgi:hypothetical protein